MKRFAIFIAGLLFVASALATTYVPVQLLNPVGSTAGQAPISTGATTPPTWGNVTAATLVAQAANTVVANVTAASASPTAVALPSCSTANSALKYTSASGFSCGTAYSLTSGTLAQFAATTSAQLAGIISDETGSGALVFATGSAINPTSTGLSTPGTGAFTTLNASANDVLQYSNTAGQTIVSGSLVTVTTWTKIFDRVNANFNASTGTFTAPATGYYQISGQLNFAAATGVVAAQYSAIIVYNGVAGITQSVYQESVSSAPVTVNFNAVVSLVAGQTLLVQAFQSSGASRTLQTGAASYLAISRLP